MDYSHSNQNQDSAITASAAMSTPGIGSGASPESPFTMSQIANRSMPVLRVIRTAIRRPPYRQTTEAVPLRLRGS